METTKSVKTGTCSGTTSVPRTCRSFTFRPRGSLARAVYSKYVNDGYLMDYDKRKWYNCDLTQVSPDLSAKFVQLEPDKKTAEFLENSEEKSNWLFTQIWYTIVKSVFSWFMTQTSINGWLRRGSMFVLSLEQYLKLVGSDGAWHKDSLIDLGAGDGKVTAHLAPLFRKVYVTEVSGVMRKLLTERGYQVLEVKNWDLDKKYDVISCLNLIDRCDTPFQLLNQIKNALKPDGLVLLALVLPFSAYVELGSRTHRPTQLLPVMGTTFEQQVESLVKEVLTPCGFKIQSWSRVPYLCEGDLQQSYYWLDDAIFVLKSNQ